MSKPGEKRTRLLAAIHAEAKARGLDRDAYEAVLESVTGYRSAKHLKVPQLYRVLDAIKKPAKKAPVRVGEERAPLMSKIDALLGELGKDRSYAGSIVKRMTSRRAAPCERIEFANPKQLSAVIAALDKQVKKK